ncbi:MAG: ABC transporter permease [Solirubrobacterales bacterium]
MSATTEVPAPITPDAVETSEARRVLNLSLTLAASEFKMRYFGSVLGYFWTLARPLLLFGVLYLAFTHFIRFGGGIDFYPAYLLTAIVLWTYFSDVTSVSVTSLVAHESLIRKMPMPLLVIPVSISMTAFLNLCLNLIAVLVFIFLSGVHPTIDWLQFPFLVAGLALYAAAVGSLVANLYVPFRDMKPIWEVVLQGLFWGTPIIYTIEAVPESVKQLIMFNPLSVVTTQMRHSVIDQSAPTATTAIGGIEWMAVPGAIVLVTFGASLLLYRRYAPRIAERL